MKFSFTAIAFVLLIAACKENVTEQSLPASPQTSVKDSTSPPAPYFPVASFLKNEIDYVDSLPVGILKFITVGKKTDSAYILVDAFNKLAEEFLTENISDSNFKKEYKESSFFDRSSNNATFYYRTGNPAMEVKRVDVVTAKGDVYDEVKSLYMEKTIGGDEPVIKKLFWKPKRNFQIITITKKKSGEPKIELIKVVWDNRE